MSINPVPRTPTLDAYAIAPSRIRKGRTKPVAMFCAEISSPESMEYIVKLYGCCELRQHNLACELFASLLGHVLGLNTPDVAVVNILPEISESINDQELKEMILNSPGYNFGSKGVGKGVMTYHSFSQKHLKIAIDIFAFDMLIRNPDRQLGDNPNMFERGDGYIVYDHELAFPYSKPELILGDIPNPWTLRGEDFVSNHVFFSPLRNGIDKNSFDSFISNLIQIRDEILTEIMDNIPDEWKIDGLDNIFDYIQKARNNPNKMKHGLLEALT